MHLDKLVKFSVVVVGVIYLILFASNLLSYDDKVIYNLAYVTNLALIFISRKQKNIALFFIFALFYTSYQRPIFYDGILTAGWTGFNSIHYLSKMMYIQYVSLLVLLIAIKPVKESYSIKTNIRVRRNPLIYYFCVMIILSMPLQGSRGRGLGGLALFEYGIILFLILYVFGKGIPFKRLIMFFLVIYYCFFAVLAGGRIETIQLLLLASIILYDLKDISYKVIIPLVLVGMYFMILIGNVRHNPLILLSNTKEVLASPLKPKDPVFISPDRAVIYSHHGDVFYSSTRMVAFTETGDLTTSQRLESFIGLFVSVFLPSRFFPEHVALSSYKRTIYSVGGGGLYSGYFFCYLGYFGVVLSSLWLAFLINKSRTTKNQLLLMYIILILSTYPRWYSYGPNVMFKMSFWVVPIMVLTNTMIYLVKPRERS